MKSVHNDRYKDRWVYNTNFHDTQLLDVENVQRLISMYRFTKPNVLFSDVVKKTSQSILEPVTTWPVNQKAKYLRAQVSNGMVIKR